MNERNDILAWLLAADEHPHLRMEVEFLHAVEELHASPDLQEALEEARAFARKHPRLIDFGAMPGDTRMRIACRLKEAASEASPPAPHPWSVRRQFAWAAVLVLFLGGMSVLSTSWLEKAYPPNQIVLHGPALPPPRRMDEFYQFVSRVTREGASLQHEATRIPELVSWLEDHEGIAPELSGPLLELKGMGCSVFQGPHGKISMVCVDLQGNRYNLFIGCARALRREPSQGRRFQLENRDVLEWVDEHNAFLLISESPDTEMPEILL